MTLHKALLPFPPSTNDIWQYYRGRVSLTAKARKFKEQANKLTMLQAKKGLIESGPVFVAVFIHQRGKIQGERKPPAIDVDNGVKITLDAMQGAAFKNDKQVKSVFTYELDEMPHGGLEVVWCSLDDRLKIVKLITDYLLM